MRLLSLNIKSEIIENIESRGLYIVDEAEDINDLTYHLDVRFYNLVLLYENDLNTCKRVLKSAYNLNTAFVILTDNLTNTFELECLKSGALDILKIPVDNRLLLARLEAIHRDNFSNILYYKDHFGIRREYAEVIDQNNQELGIRGKACDILRYLVQNKHRPPISKDELICAIWEDPEMVCQNVIEVNVNQIRSKLKRNLNIDVIETVRNRGYKITNKKVK